MLRKICQLTPSLYRIIKKLPFVEEGNSSPAQVWSNLKFFDKSDMRLSNILGLPEERDRDRRLEAKPQIIQLGPGTWGHLHQNLWRRATECLSITCDLVPRISYFDWL